MIDVLHTMSLRAINQRLHDLYITECGDGDPVRFQARRYDPVALVMHSSTLKQFNGCLHREILGKIIPVWQPAAAQYLNMTTGLMMNLLTCDDLPEN